MSLHADLLEQAQHLLQRERTRPKQASLRRAVPSAYYALFHLLTYDASRLFVKDEVLLARLNRTYNHGDLAKAARCCLGGTWPSALDGLQPPLNIAHSLIGVARAFVDLQQARHEADYDLAKCFTRKEASDLIQQVIQSFQEWNLIRATDWARIFLGSFLLWKDWDRVR